MALASLSGSMTKEAFEQIPDAFKRFEVVDGQLVEKPEVGIPESIVAARIIHQLALFLNDPKFLQILSSEARFRIQEVPELIRGCDVAYVPRERYPMGRPTKGIADFAPALAVEVVSPSNSAVDIQRRINEWLTAGTDLVWVIYPEERQAYVYRSRTDVRSLTEQDSLDGGQLLPGLSIPLTIIFADL